MESNLLFTVGNFCPSFSKYCGKLTEMYHYLKFQEGIERRLDERTDYQGES